MEQAASLVYGQPLSLPLQLHELQRQVDAARRERAAAEERSAAAEAGRDELAAEVEAVSQQVLDLDTDLRASQVLRTAPAHL